MTKHKRYVIEFQNSKDKTKVIGKVDNFEEFKEVLFSKNKW